MHDRTCRTPGPGRSSARLPQRLPALGPGAYRPRPSGCRRRLGFTDDDLVGQGSDRLVDTLVA
jgi:hypothetical protein